MAIQEPEQVGGKRRSSQKILVRQVFTMPDPAGGWSWFGCCFDRNDLALCGIRHANRVTARSVRQRRLLTRIEWRPVAHLELASREGFRSQKDISRLRRRSSLRSSIPAHERTRRRSPSQAPRPDGVPGRRPGDRKARSAFPPASARREAHRPPRRLPTRKAAPRPAPAGRSRGGPCFPCAGRCWQRRIAARTGRWWRSASVPCRSSRANRSRRWMGCCFRTAMTTFVSRQIICRTRRRLAASTSIPAFLHERHILVASKRCKPRIDIEFHRLQQNAAPEPAHAHFRARQPEFLGQPDGLAAAVLEQFRGFDLGHESLRSTGYGVDTICIYNRKAVPARANSGSPYMPGDTDDSSAGQIACV